MLEVKRILTTRNTGSERVGNGTRTTQGESTQQVVDRIYQKFKDDNATSTRGTYLSSTSPNLDELSTRLEVCPRTSLRQFGTGPSWDGRGAAPDDSKPWWTLVMSWKEYGLVDCMVGGSLLGGQRDGRDGVERLTVELSTSRLV